MAALAVSGVVAVPLVATAQVVEYSPIIEVGLNPGSATFGDFWPAWASVAVTADDPATPEHPDFTVSVTSDDTGHFILPEGFASLQPGWSITATDGTYTKTHTVRDITITYVNPATNSMSGTAEPNSLVDYAGNPGESQGVSTTANSSGEWSADVSSVTDIVPGSTVVVLQNDDPLCFNGWYWVDAGPFEPCDGDFTYFNMYVPTLDELLGNMVAEGQLPNAGVANSITKLAAGKAPLKALTSQLSGLVRARKITQLTMNEILAALPG